MRSEIARFLHKHTYVYCIIWGLYFFIPRQLRFFLDYFSRKLFNAQSYSKLKELKNKNHGERCFIIGTGPSLTLKDIELVSKECCFSVNSIVLLFNQTIWRPDYYVICDNDAYVKLRKEIRNSNLKNIFLAHSNSSTFDIKGKISDIYFPLNLLNHGMVIPKTINCFSDNAYNVVYDGHSVVYATLQLAVYMGFKEICLLGVDCNYEEKKQNHIIEYTSAVVPNAADLMRGSFKCAKKFADANGIKIYDATRNGKLSVFTRVKLEDYVAGKCHFKEEKL